MFMPKATFGTNRTDTSRRCAHGNDRRTPKRPRTTKTTICFEAWRGGGNPMGINELRAKSRVDATGRLLFFVVFLVHSRFLPALRAPAKSSKTTAGALPDALDCLIFSSE